MSTFPGLSPDTEVILLLCGRFDSNADEFKPLSTPEYNKLVRWLDDQGLRPSSLIDGLLDCDHLEQTGLAQTRLERLLARGAALAVAVEKWHSHSLWVISRADPDYPQRYLDHLKSKAPPILFGIGDRGLLQEGGLAVVGSRDVDEAGIGFAKAIASRAATENITIISGGARGVDQTAMIAALTGGGAAVGVLANNLNREAVNSQYRDAIVDRRLVLVSPYTPTAGFTVGQAMGRNKLIYALADWALVVDSSVESGGTWAGAVENLRKFKVPLFVRDGEDVPEGNQRLLQEGGIPLDDSALRRASLKETLNQLVGHQTSVRASNGPEPPLAGNGFSGESIFDAVWPQIEKRLSSPCALKVLKDELGPLVTSGQVERWLRHAEDLGLVERKGRPLHYHLNRAASSTDLQSALRQSALQISES